MAKSDRPLVVTDAGPLIHLDELDALNFLEDFPAIYTTQLVWSEVRAHRLALVATSVPHLRLDSTVRPVSPALAVLVKSMGLDDGETSAISLAEDCAADLILCDDAAARLAAEALGYRVHGTIGVLIRAIRQQRKTKTQVLEILRAIPARSTLFIKSSLLDEICAKIANES